MARHLAESVSGPVYFAAYTGKAAHVLSKAGAQNVSTIHKLCYVPKEKSQQRLKKLQVQLAQLRVKLPLPEKEIADLEKEIEAEKVNLARPLFRINRDSPLPNAGLVVIDEYSMVDGVMGEDLLSFGCPILALGDPGQLPPVQGKSFFSGDPDFFLTDIRRQALDNPIIWMSKETREGRPLKPGSYGDSEVVKYVDTTPEQLADRVLGSDQLLVGKNITRRLSNNRVRQLRKKKGEFPLVGDRLVCLKNNHDLGILNGQIWKARTDSMFDGDYVILDLDGEDGERVQTSAHPEYFRGEEPAYYELRDADSFDYGYALTVHKSQGSQWDSVVLFDEWHFKDREKWLYTAVTRAAEKVYVVKM